VSVFYLFSDDRGRDRHDLRGLHVRDHYDPHVRGRRAIPGLGPRAFRYPNGPCRYHDDTQRYGILHGGIVPDGSVVHKQIFSKQNKYMACRRNNVLQRGVSCRRYILHKYQVATPKTPSLDRRCNNSRRVERRNNCRSPECNSTACYAHKQPAPKQAAYRYEKKVKPALL